ncbi:MAG: N-acyl-L-amino acid amidohydrolase [Bacteroidetes bacterium GWF2_49_14]|nr:MAG: N-acyl-L-amino acid amidohydrolase [Bacteroidetes bacterium GWF2_49_14]HBB92288.1 amidohydrolase [Bacteroidales bacterium]
MLADNIRNQSDRLAEEIIRIRRRIHANPELSFEEEETARLIEKTLDSWGIPHDRVAGTGVTGLIKGALPGNYLVLRADIDALPIQEANSCEYRSRKPGIMHACGHDVHAAALLGTIRILNDMAGQLNGTIRFLFQPGEELLPGGALKVLESGLLENPKPDFMIAQHVYPELPAGNFGFRPGAYMASTDEIYISIHGTGGHGALPHLLVDPVLIGSHIVVGLQQVISRKIPAGIPAVLSFGRFDAQGSTNVVPPVANLAGTFRIMDETWRARAHKEIIQTAEGIAQSMGASVECRIVNGYPSLSNDPALTETATSLAVQYAGAENVHLLPLRMTGEDFARYAQIIPALFYRLGTGGDKKKNPVHHPEFDVDETSIRHGTGLLAFLAASLTKKR